VKIHHNILLENIYIFELARVKK